MFPWIFLFFFGNASWFFFAVFNFSWNFCFFCPYWMYFLAFVCFFISRASFWLLPLFLFRNASAFPFWASFLVRFFLISCIFYPHIQFVSFPLSLLFRPHAGFSVCQVFVFLVVCFLTCPVLFSILAAPFLNFICCCRRSSSFVNFVLSFQSWFHSVS